MINEKVIALRKKPISWDRRFKAGADWPTIVTELELFNESARKIVFYAEAKRFETEYLELALKVEWAYLLNAESLLDIEKALNRISKRNYLVAVMVVLV